MFAKLFKLFTKRSEAYDAPARQYVIDAINKKFDGSLPDSIKLIAHVDLLLNVTVAWVQYKDVNIKLNTSEKFYYEEKQKKHNKAKFNKDLGELKKLLK